MSKVSGGDFKNSTDLAGNLSQLPNDTKFYATGQVKTIFQAITDGNIGGSPVLPSIVTNSVGGNYSMSATPDNTLIRHTATTFSTYQLPTPGSAAKKFYFMNDASTILPRSSVRIQPASGHGIRMGNEVVQFPGYISLDSNGPIVSIQSLDSTNWFVVNNTSQMHTKNTTIGYPKEVALVGRNTWVQKGNDIARTSQGAFALNGYAYVAAGGAFLSTVNRYNDLADTWLGRTAIPVAISQTSGMAFNGFGYIVGGTTGTAVSTNYQYNDSADTWATKLATLSALDFLVGVGFNGYGYALGGRNAAGTQQSAVYRYNDSADTQLAMAALSLTRQAAGVGVLNGYIYHGTGASSLSVIEQYNDSSNTWITRANYPISVSDTFGGFVNGGYFLLVGGTTTSSSNSYNDATNAWTANLSFSGSPTPTNTGSTCGSFVLNGQGYVSGGQYAGVSVSSTYEYN
ncbi:MAG: hypothetical protein SGI96_21220 [Bacteroidota bacterium]|nr:hypothetical protein [Bacteroidota bacterium]